MIKFIASLVVGAIFALLLLTQNDLGNTGFIKGLESLLYEHTIMLYFISGMLLLLPATILYFIGKKAYSKMISSDEDDIDDSIMKKAGYLDLSMSFLVLYP
jgi:hypothetical protein